MESLARLFGSVGIDYLSEAILKNGIVENGRKWMSLSRKLKSIKTGGDSASNNSPEAAETYLDILSVCVRFN